jgi:uncharacterized protein (DUF1810 family)
VDQDRLQRFVEAQDANGTHERALAELRTGRKTSHWMWFVFPQIAGLGQSEMSRRYAIASAEEARDYLNHPVLGPRLIACAEAMLGHENTSAEAILGGIDAVKLRSSMTLFAAVASEQPVFQRVLDRYFDGEPDAETKRRL